MRVLCLLVLLAVSTQAYKWKDCGVRYDRLHTTKLDVAGSMTSGSKVTVTASGTTNLHAPLTSGAWQVRIWETGVAKSTHTEFGDLMKAIKFNDPSKPTSFTLSVSFTLPAKQKSGVFDANLVALDQDKANYMCLDVDYSYPSTSFLAAVTRKSGCTSDKDCPSSYCQNAKPGHPGSCHGCGDACCETDKDCPGSYCANDPTKMPPYTCHDTKMAMTMESESEYCLHTEDPADHKCYEGCASSHFVNKGVKTPGPCPSNYGVTEKSKVNDQCEDGVTNLRYCPGHDVNVTMKIKGLAMVEVLGAIPTTTPEYSIYCMKDPSKHPPYYCHVPPLPTSCKTTKDCVTPWYNSWCMNDSSKKAPFVCKQELPPTCTTDADCKGK